MSEIYSDRRSFIRNIGLSSLGASTLILPRYGNANNLFKDDSNINHIGPKEGFSPQIGTLISMLDWLSNSVINVTNKLTVEQLDYLHDENSNSIGSLLLHIAAVEVIYQDMTFHDLQDFSSENKLKWNVAMELGNDAHTKIKGNNIQYYFEAMNEVRNQTKLEMKKRDDVWLLGGETKDWNWNNYCKWFHVTEHFANHRGQMTWYKKRLPKK
jgi:uncharacterized damage-inducible protein DinB